MGGDHRLPQADAAIASGRIVAVGKDIAQRAAREIDASGLMVTPGILPLFVAAGSGVAMVATFVGFRWFAFRA